eukprot:Awhi_evm2s9887
MRRKDSIKFNSNFNSSIIYILNTTIYITHITNNCTSGKKAIVLHSVFQTKILLSIAKYNIKIYTFIDDSRDACFNAIVKIS